MRDSVSVTMVPWVQLIAAIYPSYTLLSRYSHLEDDLCFLFVDSGIMILFGHWINGSMADYRSGHFRRDIFLLLRHCDVVTA